MRKIFLLSCSALLFCTVAQGIVCKVCESGNDKGCYFKEDVCKTQYGKCYTYASYVDDELYFMSYNCIYHDFETWYCNKTEKGQKYIHVETCCDTDKCNGEVPRLPHNWD